MKKTLYTNELLFTTIVNNLKEKDLLLDILDYHLADHHSTPIKTVEWDCKGDLKFGGSEGIYLDMYAVGDIGDGVEKVRLGVFKTLREDRAAFGYMAKLMADFIWETRDFVNEHMDDFTWTGYDVDLVKDEKRREWKWARNKDTAMNAITKHKDWVERNQKWDFDYAVIVDNATGKEIRVNKADI